MAADKDEPSLKTGSTSKKKKVVDIRQRAGQKLMETLADHYANSLPTPSARFERIVFVYPEDLATAGRELLFRQLNEKAREFNCGLIISDVGYGRCGLYVKIDELGGDFNSDEYFDDIVDNWSISENDRP